MAKSWGKIQDYTAVDNIERDEPNNNQEKYESQYTQDAVSYTHIDVYKRQVPDIHFQFRVLFTPQLCRHTEHRHVQHVRFIGIDDICLCWRNLCRDKILFYGIGVYAVSYTHLDKQS